MSFGERAAVPAEFAIVLSTQYSVATGWWEQWWGVLIYSEKIVQIVANSFTTGSFTVRESGCRADGGKVDYCGNRHLRGVSVAAG